MNHKVLEKLTLEEKIQWSSGRSLWTILGSSKMNMRELILADGPHGLRAYKEKPSNTLFNPDEYAPSTMFPIATAMSSTFNRNLIKEVGASIGKECNHYSVDVLLAPGVNLKRSPLGGRNFEYYSEDPYLTRMMATSYINGVQSQKVGACIKHFALNEQENQRRFIDTIVDERTLHEMYLYPFYHAMKDAKPWAVMSSYNKINGHYASESSYLLKDVLRSKWNYEGVVISDWGAAQDRVKSIKNGLNLEMPGPSEFVTEVNQALKNETLLESELDEILMPLVTLYEKAILNDLQGTKADFDEHHKIAQQVSKEAIVLLENDGTLPLEKKSKIAVIGGFADNPRINGGGSATLLPHTLENPLESLQKQFTVDFAQGYNEDDTSKEMLSKVQEVVLKNDIVIYFTGTTPSLETEGKDRAHMGLPQAHIDVFNVIKQYNKKVIVILNNGSSLDLRPILNDSNAIIESWLLGSANAEALVSVLTGDTNPSGRLSETFPICLEHTPHAPFFPSKQDEVNYVGDIIRNGYRYYDTHNYPVQYPFGYGLSYTTFEYSELKLSTNSIQNNEDLEVSLTVTNTGNQAGQEVVQLYVKDNESYYPRPEKELKEFTKVRLQPGEVKEVSFTLSKEAFSFYSPDLEDFVVEEGYFTILVGKNVQDICLSEKVFYRNSNPIRTNLTLHHPLKNFAIYKPNAFNNLVEKYRSFPWYEVEEPTQRVLNRIKSQFKLTDSEFIELKDSLLK